MGIKTIRSKCFNKKKLFSVHQGNCIQAEYVWVDGSGESLRCKSMTLPDGPVEASDLPLWNFDGSSTGQAYGADSDVSKGHLPCSFVFFLFLNI